MTDPRHLHTRARGWVDANLDRFASAVEGEGVLTPTKRLGELALIAALLLDRGEDAHARRWLDHAWAHYGDGALLAREIAAQPATIAMYPAFYRHGHRAPAVEEAIAAALSTVEEPTLRLLLACSLAATGLPCPWPLDTMLAESPLARERPAWEVDAAHAYVASHVALFLAPTGTLPERCRRYLTHSLPAWIAHFVRAGDLDLVGELVIVTHTLGTCVSPSEWQVLIDAQEPDGLVPFRATWRGREVPAPMRFLANYHSTLVACAAGGMCGHSPFTVVPVACLAELFVEVDDEPAGQ